MSRRHESRVHSFTKPGAGRLGIVAAALGLSLAACNESAIKPGPDGGASVAGLTGEQASRVVAKVGDRTITVADFARTLERMDQYDRFRYQSKERRRELLSEMVDVELLAAEARRRGLEKDPEAQEAIRQVLRDAVLADARRGVPSPAEIPSDEVRAYYESHVDKFAEPERRRVAAIVVDDAKKAEDVLKQARKATTPVAWGELFAKYSSTAPKKREATPVELAGDLGIVGAPDDERGGNANVPEPVRAAAFTIGQVGAVLDKVVEADGKFYVVRLNGLTSAHKRSLAEADRSIRVLLVQDKIAAKEKAFEEDLRKKIPVEVDEKALAAVRVPALPQGGSGEADRQGADGGR